MNVYLFDLKRVESMMLALSFGCWLASSVKIKNEDMVLLSKWTHKYNESQYDGK